MPAPVGTAGTLRETAEKVAGRKLWIQTIKNQNQDKNFVQRMNNMFVPGAQRRISNPDGSYSSLLISSSENDGKEMLFPTIVQPGAKSGRLVKMPMKAAYKYAVKSGENIKFNSPEQADEFASHYKEQ